MEKKKIATSVDILINVDRFEHIQITKYSEKEITYETPEEMIHKEDQLTDELIKDVVRTMKSMPEKMGDKAKSVGADEEWKDKLEKKIPTWLQDGAEPNIANTAQKNTDKAVASAHAESMDLKIKKESNEADTDAFLTGDVKKVEEPKKEAKVEEKDIDADLFGDEEDLFK